MKPEKRNWNLADLLENRIQRALHQTKLFGRALLRCRNYIFASSFFFFLYMIIVSSSILKKKNEKTRSGQEGKKKKETFNGILYFRFIIGYDVWEEWMFIRGGGIGCAVFINGKCAKIYNFWYSWKFWSIQVPKIPLLFLSDQSVTTGLREIIPFDLTCCLFH